MSDRISHLRGTKEEWSESDRVVNDGELALFKTADGRYRVKIGDGKRAFSALPFTDGIISETEGSECSVTLATGLDVRAGALSLLTLALPEVIPEELYCSVTFDSGSEPTTLEYLFTEAHFSGDSVVDGVFIPEASTHYTLLFWYDGRLQCHVRGVAAYE